MAELNSLLAEAQRIGLIGPGDLAEAIDHARGYVAQIPAGVTRLVDVGSGGGLPGLVIAAERPEIDVTLMDRRGRACDMLRRAVVALGWGARVRVIHADAEHLAREPDWRASFEVATCRGLAFPALAAELVIPLLEPGGRLVVSVTGTGERWSEPGLALLDARVLSRDDGFLVVEAGRCPDRFPRARRRQSVFELAGD